MSSTENIEPTKQTFEDFIVSIEKLKNYILENDIKDCDDFDLNELYELYLEDTPRFLGVLQENFLPEGEYGDCDFYNVMPINDYRFLDEYNPRVRKTIMSFSIANKDIDPELKFNGLLETVDDFREFIEIVHKHFTPKTNTSESVVFEEKDFYLDMLNAEINESKFNNTTKMERLFSSVINFTSQGDVELSFLFKSCENLYYSDQEVTFKIHSFVLIDNSMDCYESTNEYGNCRMILDTIFVDDIYNKEIYTEFIRYLYTGTIDTDLSKENILILLSISDKLKLKLSNICRRLLKMKE